MKKLIFLIGFIVIGVMAYSQAVETKSKFDKKEVSAASIEIDAEQGLMEKVIEEDMKTRGFGKAKSSKGYNQYAGINFNDISVDKIDMYIKSERKSKKEKSKTVVNILVSKGYDNFVSGAADANIMKAMQEYLNGLVPKAEKALLENQIAEQEDGVKKAEKKAANLEDDLSDLEKKKRKIEEDIADKKKEIERQKDEVAKQRAELEAAKNRRKG
jgi:hypothetical protein